MRKRYHAVILLFALFRSALAQLPVFNDNPTHKLQASGRVTIFVDATPTNRKMVTLQPYDIAVLSGTLAALTRNTSAPVMRVVLMNVDLQKEYLRIEPFNNSDFKHLIETLITLQFATVDSKTARQNPSVSAFLTDLLEHEVADRTSIAIFLGPAPHTRQRVVRSASAKRSLPVPAIYYLKYRPPDRLDPSFNPQLRVPPISQPMSGNDQSPGSLGYPSQAASSDLTRDTIESLVRKVKGHTFEFSTPLEFARAIDRVSSRP
jgi:hypothetical protein